MRRDACAVKSDYENERLLDLRVKLMSVPSTEDFIDIVVCCYPPEPTTP